MFCKFCGKENPEKALFCIKCGKQLNNTANQEDDTPKNEPSQKDAEKPKETQYPSSFGRMNPNNQFVSGFAEKRKSDFVNIHSFIDLRDSKNLCIKLSVSFVLILLCLRFLGGLITSIIVAAANGFLVYSQFKHEKRIDYTMIACSAVALVVGILLYIFRWWFIY